MSRFVLACFRDPADPRLARLDDGGSAAIAARLTPDGLAARPTRTLRAPGVRLSVVNPGVGSLLRDDGDRGGACALGALRAADDAWHRTAAPSPDGSFALARFDANAVELLTDAAASRTVWYCLHDGALFASSSLRAMAMLLGDLVPDHAAAAWMLSAGALGPGRSWDRRVRSLPPDATLRLDRAAFALTVRERPVRFTPAALPLRDAERQLRSALEAAVGELALDREAWVLPLSGGYDSRGLLLLLRGGAPLHTVTWGLAASPRDPANDAYVAQQLAERFGTHHEYLTTDLDEAGVGDALGRFVALGEGRTDQVSGYLDGFAIWRHLAARGFHGFIRGDEGFGWEPAPDEVRARRGVGLATSDDLHDLGLLLADDGVRQAQRDDVAPLARRGEESVAAWRDRLYHSYRLPVVLGPLNEMKCAYLDASTPYLSRSVLELVRTFPDDARTLKRAFRGVVASLAPDQPPFASRSAIAAPRDLFARPRVQAYLRAHTDPTGELLAPLRSLLGATRLRARLRRVERGASVALDVVENLLRRRVYRRSEMVRHSVDPGLLAFRLYLIASAERMLRDDAAVL